MKRSRGEIFGSALVAALVVAAVFAVVVSVATADTSTAAEGSWTDWEYSKSVVVKENSGQTLTDYQVLLNLSGEDFPVEAKSDGSDLRFVDAEEEEELSYWLEKFDAENETGRVWVKVPEIPADGEAKFKMLYGNPSAESASNGSAVFEFFDDFESYGVGTKPPKWSQSGNRVGKIDDAVSVSGTKSFKLFGVLGSCWGNIAHRHFEMQPPFCIDFDVYNGNEKLSGCHPHRGGFVLNTGPSWTTDNRHFIEFIGDGTIKPLPGETYSTLQWYHVKMKYAVNETNATISYWINDDYKGTFSHSKRSYESDLKWYTISSNEGSAWFDNTRLRNYVDPEPTVEIEAGEEEEPTISVSTDKPEYSPGDRLTTTIKIANPTEENLTFQWFWVVPQFSVCVPVQSAEIPAGYDETLGFTYTIPDWGATPFLNVFCVQLLEVGSGEVLDADVSWWAYSPGREATPVAVGEAEVEIADEIKEAVEKMKKE